MTRFRSQSPAILLLLFLLPISMCFSSGVDHNPCVKRHERWQCTNLNYIPVLPPNTTNLVLVMFHVPVLSRKTLSNLTGLPLKVLEFRRPIWKKVTTDVFTDMTHLCTLIIKRLRSMVNLHNLFLSLQFTSITTVRLYRVAVSSLPISLFEGLRNTSLHRLHLSDCGLTIFNGTSVSQLTKLQMLDLSLNNNLQIEAWGHLPVLKYLNLSETYIEHLPTFQNVQLAYPELRTLALSLSDDHSLNQHTFEGLPKLTKLTIQVKDELLMAPGTIGSILPKLKNLWITGTPTVKFGLEDKAIVSSSLRSLKLKNVTLKSFNEPLYCHNLTDLILSRFKAENPLQLIRILPTLQRLRHLEVSESRLTAVPASICNITSLTRLNLRGNFIYSWRNKNCQVMGNLKEFSLAKNYITKIKRSSFSEALWNNSQLKWDLSSNNYQCNCGLLWFRDWLKKTERRIIGYPKGYRCKLLSGLKIQIKKFVLTLEYCKNRFRTSPLLLLAVCLGSLSLVVISCSVVAYVKRWSVRYWCYLLWARHRKYTSLVDNVDYIYDAFVCYSGSDISWVLNKLIPVIEETEGFQLCLHDRDFKPGYDIVDNIVESVQTSRKVVLVLSPEFARSSWCKYEASLAEQRLLEENKDVLVPVLLEEIPDHIQSKRLATLLKRKTYLEWTNDTHGQEMFWKRFADILGTPSVYMEI